MHDDLLDAGRVPVGYVLFPDDGHGFQRPANIIAFTETVIHQFLLGLPSEPPRLSRSPTLRAPLVQQPRPAQRFTPLLPRTHLPAVDLTVVAYPTDSDLAAASAAEEQSQALSCLLVDRPGTRPPAPLDFPAPRPYPQRVDRFSTPGLVPTGLQSSAKRRRLSEITINLMKSEQAHPMRRRFAAVHLLFVISVAVFSVLMLGWMWNGVMTVARGMATMSSAGQAGALVGAAFGLLILSSILILGNRALILTLKRNRSPVDPDPSVSKKYSRD